MTEPQRAVPVSLPAYLHHAHTYDADGRVDGYQASCGEALCPEPGWTISGPRYVVDTAAWEHVRAHDEGTLRLTAELLRSAMHEARRYRAAWLSARRRAARYASPLNDMDALVPHAGDCEGTRCPQCKCCQHSGPDDCPGCTAMGCECGAINMGAEARSAQPDLEGTR